MTTVSDLGNDITFDELYARADQEFTKGRITDETLLQIIEKHRADRAMWKGKQEKKGKDE